MTADQLQPVSLDPNSINAPNYSIPSGSGGMTFGQGIGAASNAVNIYQGLQRGGVSGYGSAAVNAASLANKVGGANIPYVGPAGNALGVYNGIKEGGVGGYANATVNAAQLYSAASAADVAAGGAGFAGAGAAGAAGVAAAPLLAMYLWASTYGDQNNTKFNANYFSTMADALNKGPGATASPTSGLSYLQSIKQNTDYQGARSELLQLLQNPQSSAQVPFTAQQLAAWGITPEAISGASSTNMAAAGKAGASLAQSLGIPEFSTPSSQHK